MVETRGETLREDMCAFARKRRRSEEGKEKKEEKREREREGWGKGNKYMEEFTDSRQGSR